MIVTCPFTEADSKKARDEWGCNCGPSALAFALQVPLTAVRPAIPGFEQKRYTTPSMMSDALVNLGRRYTSIKVPEPKPDLAVMFSPVMALVYIQFTGPWTAPGANPRWAYTHTHWIATWRAHGVPTLFDVNGGIRSIGAWETEILPRLVAGDRRDGGWYPRHVWRLE